MQSNSRGGGASGTTGTPVNMSGVGAEDIDLETQPSSSFQSAAGSKKQIKADSTTIEVVPDTPNKFELAKKFQLGGI